MVAPLRLKGPETSGPNSDNPTINAGVSVYAFQEMSESEVIDGISYRLLREFAKIDLSNPKTGDLTTLDTIGDTPTTSAGDFVDTTRNLDVGGKGTFNQLSQITTQQTSIYQVLTPVTGQIVRPLCYQDTTLREMTDAEIFNSILVPTMNRMTNFGIGSYNFSVDPPRNPSTGDLLPGVWTSVLSVNDRYKVGTIPRTSAAGFVNNNQPPTASVASYVTPQQSTNVVTTYRLYRKIDDDAPPASQPRPVKWANTAERGKHIVEMTNSEILTLLVQFRNMIVNDGRGRYRFQESAPAGGTWSRRGDSIVDLLNSVTSSTFATATIGNSVGFFSQLRFYSRTGRRSFTGTYTGFFIRFYSGDWTSRNSSDPFAGFFTGTYTGSYTSQSQGTVGIAKYYNNVTINTFTSELIDNISFAQNTDVLWVKRAN